MLKGMMKEKSCPTDLTWEEQNPFSYRLNHEVLTKLEWTIEQVKKRNVES